MKFRFEKFSLVTVILANALFSSLAFSTHENSKRFTLPENVKLHLPFSDAVQVDDTVYLSGQIGNRPGEMSLVPGGIEAEATQALDNITLILKHFDLNLTHIVKCQVMLADISDWQTFNRVYKQYFTHSYPARSAFATAGLAMNARVEIECLASIP